MHIIYSIRRFSYFIIEREEIISPFFTQEIRFPPPPPPHGTRRNEILTADKQCTTKEKKAIFLNINVIDD
jgi:hypothetical protein